jgi:hypothetical protein
MHHVAPTATTPLGSGVATQIRGMSFIRIREKTAVIDTRRPRRNTKMTQVKSIEDIA